MEQRDRWAAGTGGGGAYAHRLAGCQRERYDWVYFHRDAAVERSVIDEVVAPSGIIGSEGLTAWTARRRAGQDGG
jgi:hypothetical protein